MRRKSSPTECRDNTAAEYKGKAEPRNDTDLLTTASKQRDSPQWIRSPARRQIWLDAYLNQLIDEFISGTSPQKAQNRDKETGQRQKRQSLSAAVNRFLRGPRERSRLASAHAQLQHGHIRPARLWRQQFRGLRNVLLRIPAVVAAAGGATQPTRQRHRITWASSAGENTILISLLPNAFANFPTDLRKIMQSKCFYSIMNK